VKGRWLWIVIGANLLVLVALAFVYPHLMVSPGPLVPGHRALATDCFACHAPWRGATAERCIACHAVPDIGLRSTKGVPITASQTGRSTAMKRSFHQELIEQDCMACHSDHAGPKLTQSSRKPFSHTLLRPAKDYRQYSCYGCHEHTLANVRAKHLEEGIQNFEDCVECHRSADAEPKSRGGGKDPRSRDGHKRD
jgi:hypothetical protein